MKKTIYWLIAIVIALITLGVADTVTRTGTQVVTGQVLGAGTQSAPAYSYSAETGSGWFLQQAGIQGLSRTGTYLLQVNGNQFAFGTGQAIAFSSGSPNSVSSDVGISRSAAGVLAVGNGTAGNASGTLKVANLNNGGNIAVPATTDTLAVLGTFAAPPALGNTTPAAVNATTFTTTGLATKYNNVNTVGNGLSATYGADDKTAQSASIAAVTLLTGGASTGGRYRLMGFGGITTSDASGATFSVTITWTQDGVARTATTGTVPFASTTNGVSLVSPMFVDASTNVTYSTTVSGAPTTGRYGIHVWLAKD